MLLPGHHVIVHPFAPTLGMVGEVPGPPVVHRKADSLQFVRYQPVNQLVTVFVPEVGVVPLKQPRGDLVLNAPNQN